MLSEPVAPVVLHQFFDSMGAKQLRDLLAYRCDVDGSIQLACVAIGYEFRTYQTSGIARSFTRAIVETPAFVLQIAGARCTFNS